MQRALLLLCAVLIWPSQRRTDCAKAFVTAEVERDPEVK